MKVAWLIQNLVPYHHARFEAFSVLKDVEGHLIEVTDRDEFSVLEFKPPSQSYTLHTLFPDRQRTSLTKKELHDGLDRCLQIIAPDCVCVSGWGMEIGQMMQLWAIQHRIPVVMFSESTSYDVLRTRWREWIKSQLVKVSSGALVGGTPHAEYLEQLGMPRSAVFLGHNVVDSSHFASTAGERPSGLPEILEQDPYFVVCSRFGAKKNIPSLVRAYSVYADRYRQMETEGCRLVIAGDGELRDEIEAEVARHDAADRVILLGPVDYASLPWLYQHAQAFVLASTTEQWGLVVNEAMAAGTPVLVSRRCGCSSELVIDGENGFQFDPFNEQEISETLWQFAALSTERKKEMGDCSKRIIADWGAERFASGLKSAVEKAVETGTTSNPLLAKLLLRLLIARGALCE